MKTNISNLNSWIICPKPNPQAALRLFCFPYAGGSSFIFRDWYDSLPPSVELCAIELPGRGRQMQLPPFSKIEPLVDASALRSHHVNKNSLLKINLKLSLFCHFPEGRSL